MPSLKHPNFSNYPIKASAVKSRKAVAGRALPGPVSLRKGTKSTFLFSFKIYPNPYISKKFRKPSLLDFRPQGLSLPQKFPVGLVFHVLYNGGHGACSGFTPPVNIFVQGQFFIVAVHVTIHFRIIQRQHGIDVVLIVAFSCVLADGDQLPFGKVIDAILHRADCDTSHPADRVKAGPTETLAPSAAHEIGILPFFGTAGLSSKKDTTGLGYYRYGNTTFGDSMKQYFYGGNKPAPYFEGWYFKCQTRDGYSLALIPAMHIREDGKKSVSLQVITEEASWWLEHPVSSFIASSGSLDIRIGGNRFSEAGLLLDIEQAGLSLHGQVSFGPFHSLKSDIMGPFRWLSNMECAHSVISMRHSLQGQLELNSRVLDMAGGAGYIEADRGRSFPAEYLWTQCMWEGCSLMVSIAAIPLGRLRFTGCICAIVLNGKEYRIATYRGVKIQSWSSQGAVLIQGKYRLEVQLLDQKSQPLRAPTDGDMGRIIHESLCAKVRYRFWRDGELLIDHTDAHTGFEYVKS